MASCDAGQRWTELSRAHRGQEKHLVLFSAVCSWSKCFIDIVHTTKQQLLAHLNPAVGCSSLVHFMLRVVENKLHRCFCRTPGSAMQIYCSIVLVSWFNPKVECQIRRLALRVSFKSSPLIVLFKASRRNIKWWENIRWCVPMRAFLFIPSWHKARKKKKPWACIQGFTYTAVCEETWPGGRKGGQESTLDLEVWHVFAVRVDTIIYLYI